MVLLIAVWCKAVYEIRVVGGDSFCVTGGGELSKPYEFTGE